MSDQTILFSAKGFAELMAQIQHIHETCKPDTSSD